jgi:hypothetical protein
VESFATIAVIAAVALGRKVEAGDVWKETEIADDTTA